MSVMNRLHIASIAAAASLLLGGSALAAVPSAGMQPLFDGSATATSTVQRATVRAAAIAHAPVAGQFSDSGAAVAPSTLTRAEVRANTRNAISHGFHVATGESV